MLDVMGSHVWCALDCRPVCQMPGCSVRVEEGEKYCVFCQWEKEQELERYQNQ